MFLAAFVKEQDLHRKALAVLAVPQERATASSVEKVARNPAEARSNPGLPWHPLRSGATSSGISRICQPETKRLSATPEALVCIEAYLDWPPCNRGLVPGIATLAGVSVFIGEEEDVECNIVTPFHREHLLTPS